MCNKAVPKYSYTLKYCPCKYITQKCVMTCAADCFQIIIFVPDWFATHKMLEDLGYHLFFKDYHIDHDNDDDDDDSDNINNLQSI